MISKSRVGEICWTGMYFVLDDFLMQIMVDWYNPIGHLWVNHYLCVYIIYIYIFMTMICNFVHVQYQTVSCLF